MPKINTSVLMSGADYFSDQFAINAHMDSKVPIDLDKAKSEHAAIRQALEQAGIKVTQTPPPEGCQDGVYTANWALVRGNKALMSVLPNKRAAEMPYAQKVLQSLGKEIVKLPPGIKFSGQGDALPCGNRLFVGSGYRTDKEAWGYIKNILGYEVIGLHTVPKRNWLGKAATNRETGWADSFFYDLDLGLAVIRPDLIAFCPRAFAPKSRELLDSLPIDKIRVSLSEAKYGYGCNLVSTGDTVVMSARAPKLKAAIEARGLKTITPDVTELGKGGGYIRCTTLTLDNA
jgi:N-dimethylarginine dimethylaminohydrolase